MKTLKLYRVLILTISMTVLLQAANAQSLEETAQHKITILKTLIARADQLGLDPVKEEMTLRTAELFLDYANWDEANYDILLQCFTEKYWTRDYAAELASGLPDKERRDMIRLLDEAIETLVLMNDSTIVRQPIPEINWANISHDKGQLMNKGKPVFLNDYMLEPDDVPELNEFYGYYDGEYISPGNTTDEYGTLKSGVANRLSRKPSGRIGQVWVDNKLIPQWAYDKYGFLPPNDYSEGNRLFTKYDIDNPGAREMMGSLLAGAVPLMADKNYTKLGYMTMNEPHFNTIADTWETGGVSEYSKEKFRSWLSAKHASIGDLNSLWGTGFENFDSVKITIPMDAAKQGSPIWYDWMKFNQYRVTEWFTFLRDTIIGLDPTALVHFKVMPRFFAENQRGQGLDFEAITRLSHISGNDAGGHYYNKYSKIQKYDPGRYSFYWQETSLSYDLFRSVAPEQIIYNSEVHYDSHDPAVDPEYIRAIYWLATMHGLNASTTWAYVRNADGSVNNRWTEFFSGTFSQNPLAINYLGEALMDMNSYSEILAAMQNQNKPLRIFYSETSAINKPTHMDDVFKIYEALYYEGLSLGYATKGIIEEQDNSDWEAILVYKTEYVTQGELDALQAYLNGGGTVIIDGVSLATNEYGQALSSLVPGSGTILSAGSLSEIKSQALALVDQKGLLPELSISETNSGSGDACTWKCVKGVNGNNVISIVNLGKSDAQLNIELKDAVAGTACTDLLTGLPVSSQPTLRPFEVYLLEVSDAVDTTTTHVPSLRLDDRDIYLNTDYNNDGSIDVFLHYDAGTGETVMSGTWNGVTCKLVEKDAGHNDITEYTGTYKTAIGRNAGVANITIDIDGATPTDSLEAGHYYALVPVFKSSKDGGTDVYLSETLTGVNIVDPTVAPYLKFDDPLKYQTTDYPLIGTLDVILEYSAGLGDTVLENEWNGVTCKLIERDESGTSIREYMSSDTSSIGKSIGIANIRIDITGVLPTDSLDAGHYYELLPVFKSSRDGGQDIYAAESVTGISLVSFIPSVVPTMWMDDRDKYLTTEYSNDGTLEAVIYYDAGIGHTVLGGNWNGVTCQLIERDETNKGVKWYKLSDPSTIGTNHGVAYFSLNISGATPTADLAAGHYYALIPVIVSSYNPDKLYYLSSKLENIIIIDSASSTPPSISLDDRNKYLTTEYVNNSTIDVVIAYDAGAGQTILGGEWNGVTCKLIEKNGSDADVASYSASDPSAIGQNSGFANVSIDISGATPTSDLAADHYYTLVPVFRSSYNEDLDILLDENLLGVTIVEPATPPSISLDDPGKYVTTEYASGGMIDVVVNYDAGNNQTVLGASWNGITCKLIEKDAMGQNVTAYSGSDPSAIGEETGVANISIHLLGATPSAELDDGHYYELVALFRSSFNADQDVMLSERVLNVLVVDTTTSVVSQLYSGSIKVYPNPANDQIFIQFDDPGQTADVSIYNVYGSLVSIHHHVNKVNIEALPEGTYILKTNNERIFFVKSRLY